MRIITGILKGRQIHIPNTLNVRPTSDRTKEGLFSTIEARKYLRDSRILDLFAGSGNLGMEAISRGAKTVLFVDNDRNNIHHIVQLADEFNVAKQIRTVTSSVEDFLQGPAVPYDFIFSDPPYDYPLMQEMISDILTTGWLQKNGWLILEHDKRHDFSGHDQCIIIKNYGRTTVSIFTPEAEDENQS